MMYRCPTQMERLSRRKVITIGDSPLPRVLTLLDLTALGIGSTIGVGFYVLAGQCFTLLLSCWQVYACFGTSYRVGRYMLALERRIVLVGICLLQTVLSCLQVYRACIHQSLSLLLYLSRSILHSIFHSNEALIALIIYFRSNIFMNLFSFNSMFNFFSHIFSCFVIYELVVTEHLLLIDSVP